MRGVNKVILVGTLGKDPEYKQFPNGGSVCNFSIATSDAWRDKNTGELKEETEWHRISASNRIAENCNNILKKGSKVYIEGSLKTRNYKNAQGVECYITEIRVETFQALDSRSQGQGANNNQNQGGYNQAPQGGYGNQGGYNQAPQGGYANKPQNNSAPAQQMSDDDDLPF